MFKSIVLVFAFAAALAHGHMEHYREQCKNELNIPDESIDKYKMWKFENDDHAACYIECVFKKMGLVSDGEFNVDLIAQRLASEDKSADELKTEIENCIDNTIKDHCQKIFKGFICFKEHNIYRIQQSAKTH